MMWLAVFVIIACVALLVAGAAVAWKGELSFIGQLRAERRADRLLKGVATPTQYRQWQHDRHMDIPSMQIPGITYRYTPGHMVGIWHEGVCVADLCLQTVEHVPRADIAAAHLLAIRACEADWLATGNLFYPSVNYIGMRSYLSISLRSYLSTRDRASPLRDLLVLRGQGQTLRWRPQTIQAIPDLVTAFVVQEGHAVAPSDAEEQEPEAFSQRSTLWVSLLVLGAFLVPIVGWALFCATHMALVASWFG